MPRFAGRSLQARIAAAFAALYLSMAAVALVFPLLSSSSLAGVWGVLLTLPWSAVFPLGTVNHVAPGIAGPLRFLFSLCAMAANAALIFLGVRWAGRWMETHRP